MRPNTERPSSDLVIRAPRAISFFTESGSENEHPQLSSSCSPSPGARPRLTRKKGSDLVIRAVRSVSFLNASGSEPEGAEPRGQAAGRRARALLGKACARHHDQNYGATIIPIRRDGSGGMEVLCAQSKMVNYLRTKRPAEKVLMYSPCDVRFLGGFFEPGHVTPLDTVLANLTSLGVRSKKRYNRSYVAERALLERAALELRLFSVTPTGLGPGAAKVFHFLCTMDAEVGDSFAAILNRLLSVQTRFCEEMGDALFSMREAVRAPLCPKFHEVRWRPAAELLAGLDGQYFNPYMREEFLRAGVGEQERLQYFRQNSHRDVLRQLCRLSAEQALEQAEALERGLRAPRGPPGPALAAPYAELRDIAPGLEQVWLLSYNLNILPYGASLWGSGQGQHARARLRSFLERIQAHGASDGGPDILALQELFATPFVPGRCLQRLAIAEMARLGYRAVTGGRPSLWGLARRRKWTDSGLVIFSRFPVVAHRFVAFTAGSGLDAGASKGALWARLELSSGKCLDVVNCHLQASHTSTGAQTFEKVRSLQLNQLRELMRSFGYDHPFVLTGDFNVDAIPEPSDPAGSYGFALKKQRHYSKDYQHMLRVLDPDDQLVDLLCGPTRDAPLRRICGPHPCTRPPRLKLPRSMQYTAKHKYPQRLDYVFYRPALPSLIEHQETRIVEFKVYDPQQADFEHLSDHFGILSCFRLRCRFSWRASGAHRASRARAPEEAARGPGAARRPRAPTPAPALRAAALLGAACALACAARPGLDARLLALPAAGLLAWALLARRGRAEEEQEAPPTDEEAEDQDAACIVAVSPYDAFTAAATRFGDRACLGQRIPQADASVGDYAWLSYRDVQREVLRLSSGLCRKFDLQRNAKVGLLGNASVPWLLCDLALMRIGVDTLCLTEPPMEVQLRLRAGGQALGLGTDGSDRAALLVTSIDEEGALAAWNREHPERSVNKGDRILEANGRRGDSRLLAEALAGEGPLELRVFRSPCELLLCSVQWLEHYVQVAQLAEGTADFRAPPIPIVVFNQAPFNEGVPAKLVAEAQYYGLQVFGLRFITHFGEVAGFVPYIGIGGSHVYTTMYRSRYGKSSQQAEVKVTLQALALASNNVAQALSLSQEDVHFSYTSPAFFAERVVMHAVLTVGGAVGFFAGVRSPRIFDDIRELGPTFLLGSPGLFGNQLPRIQALHVGPLSRLCFAVQRWALRRSETQERRGCLDALARLCLEAPASGWLRAPFRQAQAALLGRRTQLRFVLALGSPGAAAMPPEVCLWLRIVLGCRVFKGLVLAEVGGFAALGEAPSFGGPIEAFAVGRALPGVCVEFAQQRLEDLGTPDRAWSRAGTVVISGPFAVSRQRVDTARSPCVRREDDSDAEVRLGVVGLQRGAELYVLGRSGSLEISLGGRQVLCDALEQLLVRHTAPWLVQLFLTARRAGGVVGIGVVRLEELWRLVRHHRIPVKCSAEPLCRSPEVRAVCLRELQRSAAALGLAAYEQPRALRLEFEPFSQERDLQTPALQLRRDRLKACFAEEIRGLFAELGQQAGVAG